MQAAVYYNQCSEHTERGNENTYCVIRVVVYVIFVITWWVHGEIVSAAGWANDRRMYSVKAS